MSTRSSVFYEEDGVHIFQDFMYLEVGLFLQYEQGAFTVVIPLSEATCRFILKEPQATPDAISEGAATEKEGTN